MYAEEKIIALIPARGGSKGIKDKNIYPLNNKPLITYTIDAAKKSRYIDEVIVSTDSERIADVAKECGIQVPFLRPSELAQDHSKTIDTVLHVIKMMKAAGKHFGALVLLQPTQPLRNADDIDLAIEAFFKNGRKGLVSISEVNDSPLLIRSVTENGELNRLLNISSTCRRQDMPAFYRVNGCIYINDTEEIDESTSFNDNPIPFIMPKERSVDIDEPADIALAEYYLRNSPKV